MKLSSYMFENHLEIYKYFFRNANFFAIRKLVFVPEICHGLLFGLLEFINLYSEILDRNIEIHT